MVIFIFKFFKNILNFRMLQACFHKILPTDPSTVITNICYRIDLWANLQKDIRERISRTAHKGSGWWHVKYSRFPMIARVGRGHRMFDDLTQDRWSFCGADCTWKFEMHYDLNTVASDPLGPSTNPSHLLHPPSTLYYSSATSRCRTTLFLISGGSRLYRLMPPKIPRSALFLEGVAIPTACNHPPAISQLVAPL